MARGQGVPQFPGYLRYVMFHLLLWNAMLDYPSLPSPIPCAPCTHLAPAGTHTSREGHSGI